MTRVGPPKREDIATATITMPLRELRKFFSTLPKLYGVEDIAKEYKCSIQYVRSEIKNKRLKAINFAACLKCTAADVQDWIEAKKLKEQE